MKPKLFERKNRKISTLKDIYNWNLNQSWLQQKNQKKKEKFVFRKFFSIYT